MMVRISLADLRDEMLAVARGDRKATPVRPTTLHAVLTEDALEMLNVIATTPSTTVRELVQRFGKAQTQVSRSLQRLAAYSILRLVRDGREIRPELVSSRCHPHSDHQRLDARSQAMHCLIAERVLANPALVEQARGTLARWRAHTSDPVSSYFSEWERILEKRNEEIAGFLAGMNEDATRLRQSSPFTNILTAEERSRFYAAFR